MRVGGASGSSRCTAYFFLAYRMPAHAPPSRRYSTCTPTHSAWAISRSRRGAYFLHGYDSSADEFCDLGDDGVSETSDAVHPIGNPMSHSTHIGFSRPDTFSCAIASKSSFKFFSCIRSEDHPLFQTCEGGIGT